MNTHFFPNLGILKFFWVWAYYSQIILECQRYSLVCKWMEYIQIFVDILLHHKANQQRKRIINIVSIVNLQAVQVQVGLLQALLPFARHIEIANKSSPLLNSLYFLSSCGYEAGFYRDRHTPTLFLYPGLRPALMSLLRSGNKQRRS